MSHTPSGGVSALAMRQGDLFEDLGPAVDAGFTTRRRIELDETSWIEHAPGWLRAGGSLFDELMATAPWEQRYRYIYARRVTEPRLTAEYGDISAAPQQLLHVITAALARQYGVAYRSTRRFLIKPVQGGQSVSLAVASGDLIVMGGRAQRDWRHSVPKQAVPAGPRISINFAPARYRAANDLPPGRP